VFANNARVDRSTEKPFAPGASPQDCPAVSAALVIGLLAYAPSAHAYLDPGTGSMILSAIVGLIATLTLAFKTWWYRLRRLFRRRDSDGGPATRPPEDEPSPDADA
jgi:hypothetical protein